MNTRAMKFVALAVVSVAAPAWAGTVTWDGGAGTMNWHDSNNWNPNGMPGAGADVTIDIPGDNTIIYSVTAGTSTINSLVCNENISFTGGQLNLNDTADINATLTLNGGTLNDGSWDVTGGSLVCTANGANRLDSVEVTGNIDLTASNGTLRIQNGLTLNGTANVTGANARLVSINTQTITDGTFIINSPVGNTNRLACDSSSVLTLGPNVSVQCGRAILGDAVIAGPTGSIVNQGEIITNVAGVTTILNPVNFTNQGDLLAAAGTLTIDNTVAWTSTGLIQSQPTAVLNLGGNVSTASLGTVQNTGGTLNVTGTITLATPLTLDASTGTWTLNGGTFQNGTLNIVAPTELVMTSSSANRFLNMTVNGDLNLTANTATLRIQNGLALNGAANVTGANARLVSLNTQTITAGTFILNGPVNNPVRLACDSGSTLTLGPAVSVQGGRATLGDAVIAGPTGNLINQGEILANIAGTTMTLNPVNLTNQGDIIATAGTLVIDNSVNWTNTGLIQVQGGVFNLGGNLSGASLGTIQNVGGTLNVTGTIDVSGSPFTLNAATGNWTLNGGGFSNGTLNIVAPAELIIASNSANRFLNMTVNGSLNLTASTATLRIQSGLSLNGTANVTGANARLVFINTQTVSSGTFIINGPVNNSGRIACDSGAVVTFGRNVLIQCGRAILGDAVIAGPTGSIVNQGEIVTNVAGTITTLNPVNFTNEGDLLATAGTLTIDNAVIWTNTGLVQVQPTAVLNLGGSLTTAALGTIQNTGGTLNVIGTITLSTPLTLNASTGIWTLNGGTFQNGTLHIVAPTELIIASNSANRFLNMTVNGNLNLSASTATLRIQSGMALNGTVNVTGANARIVSVNTQTITSGTFILNGPVNNPARIACDGGSTLTLGPAVTVQCGRANLGDAVIAGPTGNLVNQGEIVTNVAGTITTLNPVNFTNQGDLLATAGTLTIDNSVAWTNTGLVQVQSTAVLNLGGNLTTAALGTIQNTGGTLNVTGTITLSTPLTLNASTGTWTLNGGTFQDGTLTILPSADLVIASNGANRFTNMTVNGNLNLTASTATLRIQSGLALNGTITVTGANARITSINNQTITSGTFIFNGPVNNNARLGCDIGSVLTLGPNVLVQCGRATFGEALIAGPTGSLINDGSIVTNAAGTTTTINPVNFTNNGTLAADAGSIMFDASTVVTNYNAPTNTLNDGTWRAGPASTLTFPNTVAIRRNNATLIRRGAGSSMPAMNGLNEITAPGVLSIETNAAVAITPNGGTLTNNGTLALDPASTLNITGNFTQTDNAVLEVLIGQVNITFLAISGNASLDGDLAATRDVGFVPVGGDQLNILTAAAVTGTFDNLVTCDLVNLVYAPTAVIYIFGENTGVLGDLNGNGVVNGLDLGILLVSWGPCVGCCAADLNGDEQVNGIDLGTLLANWTF